jgi:hypothetical protein
MPIDPAVLSSVSALVGALIGGGASIVAAIYTRRTRTAFNEAQLRPQSGRLSTRTS